MQPSSFSVAAVSPTGRSVWGLSCTTRAARKEVVDALAPKREAWILERQELCPDDEDSEEQDLRLVVKQLRAELHRLQSRVHALERGDTKNLSAERSSH